MSLKDKIKAQVEAFDLWARPWAEKSKWNAWAYEFLLFGLKQAWACLFGGAMIALLVGTHLFWPDNALIARYDFLVLAAVAIQGLLLATKLERWEEAIVILIFHVVGTIMEIFKTAHGSWIYPEDNILRIGGVPLFSGFMYASVGSYIIQAWRLFDLRIRHHPPYWMAVAAALAIYLNFFTHHWLGDYRWYIAALVLGLYARTSVLFRPLDHVRKMPLLLAFVLIGFFLWLAENISTFYGIWSYPNQMGAWSRVHWGKWSSWSLLVIMTFTIVAGLKHVKASIHVPPE